MRESEITSLFILLVGTELIYEGNCKSYEGYKVYQITPHTHDEIEFINKFHNDPKLDIWEKTAAIDDSSDIMVGPEDQWDFEQELRKHGVNYKIVVDDVERLIQNERIERGMTRSSLGLGGVTFASYMLYSEQMAYLRRLGRDYPQIVTVSKIGESHEGRDLLTLRISTGPSLTTTPKPTIFIDAGIHCREWIAPPVALYIIHQLVENSTNSALYQDVDWVIVPNLNPDGYVFTQSNDRLWRKNRRLTEGASCYGTDLNRNFAHMWMFDGASNNSCSATYAGPKHFSEPESQAIRDWFLQNGENVKLYLTFHSFGSMILYPWGYNRSLPENHQELQNLGEQAARAIEEASAINSKYIVNSSAIALYPAAGGSDDWVKADAGVELSYTIELPEGDAPYFFMLPARQILPVVQETWEGVKVLHKYIEARFSTNNTQPQDNFRFWRGRH